MKILFLRAYYNPEITPGIHLTNDVIDAFVTSGFEVNIKTPYPSRGVDNHTREEYIKNKKHEVLRDGKLVVDRFFMFREGKNSLLRAFRYALCLLMQTIQGLRAKDIDVLYVSSTPPINGLLMYVLKKVKKFNIVYDLQDVFPDSMVSTGMTKKGSVLWKIGRIIENITYKSADKIIVISDAIKENIMAKGVPEDKITVIYNWIDTEKTVHIKRENNRLFDELGLSKDKFYVTYAGNLGNSQNVSLLVECAKHFKEYKDIMFVIFGNGTEKENLEKAISEAGLNNIKLFPMQPLERVSEVYSISDVSFVLCKKGVGGGGFPSKAATIMATETPVIASFDEKSDLCRIIDEGQAGICTEPENIQMAVDAIIKLYNDRELCKAYGVNGRKLAENKFSKEKSVNAKVEVLRKVANNNVKI